MAVLQTVDGRFLTRRRPAQGMPAMSGGLGRPLWFPAGDGSGDVDTLASYATIYRTQPVVAAAVNKLARQIATLPLKVFRRGGEFERERLDATHPLVRLLNRPLPRRGAVHAKQWMIFPALLHGNSLVGKLRAEPDGPPVMLLPLDWPSLSAYAEQGQFVEWWSTVQFDGGERWIRAQDAIHLAWESPAGEIGVSPLEQLGTTIQLEDAAKRQQKAAFRNGIFPSIAVSLGGQNGRPPSADMVAMTRDSLNTLHSNPDQAFKALLLAPDTSVTPLAITAREAELTDTRRVNHEEVAMCYDVPPPLLGDLRHATLANLAEFSRQFYTDIIRPWLTLIEETLQAQLIDSEPWGEAGLYVEFDLSEKLKGEPKEQAEVAEIGIRSAQLTPNEARAVQNRQPEGDPADPGNPANKLYLPVNNLQPIGTAAGPDALADRVTNEPSESPSRAQNGA